MLKLQEKTWYSSLKYNQYIKYYIYFNKNKTKNKNKNKNQTIKQKKKI